MTMLSPRKRIEQALSESELRYQQLIEQAADGIFLTDQLGGFLLANTKLCEMLQYTPEEISAMNVLDTYPPDLRDTGVQRLTALKDGTSLRFERPMLRKDGSVLIVEASVTPLPQGGVQAIVHDITHRKQAEEKLRESEEKFRNVVNSLPTGMLFCRLEPPDRLVLIGSNPAVEHLLGFDPEPLAGQLIEDAFPNLKETHLPRLYRDVASGVKDQQTFDVEYRDERFGGHFEVHAFRTSQNMLAINFIDITSRRNTEETLRKTEAIFSAFMEKCPVYVFFKDSEAKAIRLSRNYENMLGRPVEEVLGRSMRELFPLELADAMIEDDLRVMRNGVPISVIEELNGHWYETMKFPIALDGAPGFLAGFTIDITDKKRAEQEVHRLNAELEARVVQRTAQLEAANRELEAFTYSVSHDLRAPVRAMDGMANILLEDFGDSVSEEGRRQLHVISSNARMMGQLIDDLLTFSRLSRLDLTMGRIDMHEMAQSIFDEIVQAVEPRVVELRLEEIPDAWGDPSMLRQVWRNLIGNAVKYTDRRNPAVIEIGSRRKGADIIYHIKDNGVGFDMQYVDKLFGVFQRLHSSADYEGTGVGLAIVQRIIRRMGGTVWAEGEENVGATFSFALPNGRR